MAEREASAHAIYVDYVCDRCGEGLMEPHGKVAYLTDPIKFPHRCTNCGHEQSFTEKYPTIRYRRGETLG